jgi:uncharacterized protein (DUF1330 family)
MSAYVIAQLQIEDAEMYRKYARQVAPTVAPFGGRLLVASDEADVLEGPQPYPRTLIGEFPTIEAAHKWYASPAYASIRELRQASTRGCVFIVPGLALAERVAPGGEREN